jgi:phage terminase small subunit
MVTTPGRKSSYALATPSFGPARLSPPADLTEPKARRFFLDLVSAARQEHFQPIDVPLLVLYCRMLAQAERATEAIAADMAGASPALLEAQRQAVKGVHDLAMRLRCSPQARLSKVNARTKRPESLAYYDRQKLGGNG